MHSKLNDQNDKLVRDHAHLMFMFSRVIRELDGPNKVCDFGLIMIATNVLEAQADYWKSGIEFVLPHKYNPKPAMGDE